MVAITFCEESLYTECKNEKINSHQTIILLNEVFSNFFKKTLQTKISLKLSFLEKKK